MLHALCSLAILFLSQVEAPSQGLDAEALFGAVTDRGLPEEARQTALEDLLRRFRDSPRAVEALLRFTQELSRSGDRWEEVVLYLHRLHASYPDTREADEAVPLVERFGELTFSELPESIGAGASFTLPASLRGALFTFYRIPPAEYRKALEADAAALPGPWQFYNSMTVALARSARRHTVATCKLEPGAYIAQEETQGFRRRQILIVGGFMILTWATPGSVLIGALDPRQGTPVEGVRLQIKAKARVVEGLTGGDGLCRLALDSEAILIASKGEEAQGLLLRPESMKAPVRMVYLTTDRPVYRPGQTVQWKAVLRDRSGSSLTLDEERRARVEIRDPSRRLLQTDGKTFNEWGSISGSFRIAEAAPLGEFSVAVIIPERGGPPPGAGQRETGTWTKGFSVSAYRKPELMVSVEPEPPRFDGGARTRIIARYFWGAPAEGVEVRWTASALPKKKSFAGSLPEDPRAWFFEKGGDSGEDAERWASAGEQIASDPRLEGVGVTGRDGALSIAIDREVLKDADRLVVSAEATDPSGLTTRAAGRIPVLTAALQVSVASPKWFYLPGENPRALARVTSPDGKAAGGIPVRFRLLARIPSPEGRPERFREEPIREAIAVTGPDGLASADLTDGGEGQRVLRAQVEDASGRSAEDRLILLALGDSLFPDRQEEKAEEDEGSAEHRTGYLGLWPDQEIYDEGQLMRILVQSSSRPAEGLLTMDREGVIRDVRPFKCPRGWTVIELPARPDLGSLSFLRAEAWSRGTAMKGSARVQIHPLNRHLTTRLELDRESYRPREKIRLSVNTGFDGRPVPAELEIGIVDASIFSLARDPTPDIRSFFWLVRPLPKYAAPMLALTTREEDESGLPDWGTDFAAPSATIDPGAVRRIFPDTLYWTAHARTGEDGKASIEIEAPDQLTRWRVVARAVSGADRFGQVTTSALTRKDVTVRLSAPRFIVEGDEVVVGALVNSDLAGTEKFSLRRLIDGVPDGEPAAVEVAPGGTARIDWKLPPRGPGKVKLQAGVTHPAGSDAVEIEVPVLPRGVERRVVKSGLVSGKWVGELVLPGQPTASTAGLRLTVTSDGAPAVAEALPFLAGYPYGCVEQTMSRFLPAVVAGRALKRLHIAAEGLERDLPGMVSRGLQRLYAFQHRDGGWGWWSDDQSHPFMTAYVVSGLATARSAGFEVDPSTIERGREALQAMEQTPFIIHARALAGDDVGKALRGAVPKSEEDLAYLILAGRRDLADQLKFTAPVVSRSETIRSAALSLRALASLNPRDPRIAPLRSWLLGQRQGAAWYSTLDTACAVEALTEVLLPGGIEPRFKARVNGSELLDRVGSVETPPSSLVQGPNRIEVEQVGEGELYVSALLRYREEGGKLGDQPQDFTVERLFKRQVDENGVKVWVDMNSGDTVRIGEEIRVAVTAGAHGESPFVLIECPIPAGTEPFEDPGTDAGDGGRFGPRELRDDRATLAVESLGAGVAGQLEFRLRATIPGTFRALPARAFEMYDPDRQGVSEEFTLRVSRE
jgi:alpha-2-macroglobulin